MTDIRKQVLETLIELGIKGKYRESRVIALDAHFVLTGTHIEGAFAAQQLEEKYPHLKTPLTSEETRFEALALGKIKPIAIYHREDATAYYQAWPEEREAWNEYANAEASKFQEGLAMNEYIGQYTGVNRDGAITNWCPPLFFPEWLAIRKKNRNMYAKMG